MLKYTNRNTKDDFYFKYYKGNICQILLDPKMFSVHCCGTTTRELKKNTLWLGLIYLTKNFCGLHGWSPFISKWWDTRTCRSRPPSPPTLLEITVIFALHSLMIRKYWRPENFMCFPGICVDHIILVCISCSRVY